MTTTNTEHLSAMLDSLLDTYPLADVFAALGAVSEARRDRGDDEGWDELAAHIDALVDLAEDAGL
jgi:hypothetical protein